MATALVSRVSTCRESRLIHRLLLPFPDGHGVKVVGERICRLLLHKPCQSRLNARQRLGCSHLDPAHEEVRLGGGGIQVGSLAETIGRLVIEGAGKERGAQRSQHAGRVGIGLGSIPENLQRLATRPGEAIAPSPRRNNSARWDQAGRLAHLRGQPPKDRPFSRPARPAADAGRHRPGGPAISRRWSRDCGEFTGFFIGPGEIVFVATVGWIDVVRCLQERNRLRITAGLKVEFAQLVVGLKTPGSAGKSCAQSALRFSSFPLRRRVNPVRWWA